MFDLLLLSLPVLPPCLALHVVAMLSIPATDEEHQAQDASENGDPHQEESRPDVGMQEQDTLLLDEIVGVADQREQRAGATQVRRLPSGAGTLPLKQAAEPEEQGQERRCCRHERYRKHMRWDVGRDERKDW